VGESIRLPSRILLAVHVEQDSGPQRSLTPRLAALRDRGTRVTALVPTEGPAAAQARALGEVSVGSPGALVGPRTPGELVTSMRDLREQARGVAARARREGADLVIVTSPRMPGALLGARRGGAAAVLYAGDPLPSTRLRRAVDATAGGIAGRLAHGVIAPSRAAAGRYRASGVPLTIVAPPIEPPDLERARRDGRALRKRLGIADDERVVCSLGALTVGRGQDALVEALSLATRDGSAWRLIIAGEAYARAVDRKYERRLRELVAARGLTERVLIAGRIDDPVALFAAADVFVNPARTGEAFGRAACEALAARCPVVSTRVGGIEDALRDGETALLVEPDSPRALADAIARLLADAELASRLADTGAADVAERFAPAVNQPQFERALAAALARARPRR
jgi:glycosyltransferase involved in cell wall biosynthesis